MRRLPLIALFAVFLVPGQTADAVIVKRHDRAGRTMTFDVRARGVQVGWYAALLRNAIHGDEIETVRIRIVPPARISLLCEDNAQSCYDGDENGGVLIIPAGRSTAGAHMFLHEYAHHIDMARSNFLVTDKPWMPSWWAARGINGLLAKGRASLTYSLGWDRAVGEIFAEDYVQLNMRSRYYIRWLDPPSSTVRSALRHDLRYSKESRIGKASRAAMQSAAKSATPTSPVKSE